MSPVPEDRDVVTTYLGAFTHEHAETIAGRLEDAGISWWYKQPGFFSQIWEFGQVRLFVDETRFQEAQDIAAGVVS